jgi:hypothetical protein
MTICIFNSEFCERIIVADLTDTIYITCRKYEFFITNVSSDFPLLPVDVGRYIFEKIHT